MVLVGRETRERLAPQHKEEISPPIKNLVHKEGIVQLSQRIPRVVLYWCPQLMRTSNGSMIANLPHSPLKDGLRSRLNASLIVK